MKDFSFNTINNFDNHIEREITGYKILLDLVTKMIPYFVESNTSIIDIGASTGKLLKKVEKEILKNKQNIKLIAIEPNNNFYQHYTDTNLIHIQQGVDSQTRFDNASIITSIFTLQFLPVAERFSIIKNIYNGLNLNGAFIFCEKVYSSDSHIQDVINSIHLSIKNEHSSIETINNKNKVLKLILRPLSEAQNKELLRKAGFKRVETFWRVNNFMAFLAVKQTFLQRETDFFAKKGLLYFGNHIQ